MQDSRAIVASARIAIAADNGKRCVWLRRTELNQIRALVGGCYVQTDGQ